MSFGASLGTARRVRSLVKIKPDLLERVGPRFDQLSCEHRLEGVSNRNVFNRAAARCYVCRMTQPHKGGTDIVQTLHEAAAIGRLDPKKKRALIDFRLHHLSLSRTVAVTPSQLGGIRWMDLDTVEQRYLLTAAADSTLEAFDVLCADDGGGHQPVELLPLFTVKRGSPAAHRYQVTSVVWYPVDTGLFVTGSADQEVKVWDTNTVQVACSFSCADKVLAVNMSSCAASHALIAVGHKQQGLLLADISSGAFTHTLDGHRNGTWCVCWSPLNEYQLFSGDGCGAVRLWDIRRSGCRALLDFNNTQRPKPTAAASTTAAVTTSTSAGGKKWPRAGNQQQQLQRGQQQLQRGQQQGQVRGQVSMRLAGEDLRAAAVAATPGTARAHEGAVTGVLAMQDGLNLVTAGSDQRVRLWDAGYLHHRLVHYSGTFNRGAFPKRMSSTPDGRVLFYPRDSDIQVFDVTSGHEMTVLSQGHYDTVTACVYSPKTGHLWSTGLDGAVLAWSPWTQREQDVSAPSAHYMDAWLAAAAGGRGRQQLQQQQGDGGSGGNRVSRTALPDVDFWSDDDELLVGV